MKKIKETIEKLIQNYKKVTDAYLADLKKWEGELQKDSVHSESFIQGKIAEIKEEMQKQDKDFNGQLKAVVADTKEVIRNPKITKPSDYQLQVSNALGFINLLGDKLTDEKAFDLVKPFIGDYETMNNFHDVFSSRYGEKGFNVTMASLGKAKMIEKDLEQLDSNFSNFFNSNTYEGSTMAFSIGLNALLSDASTVEDKLVNFDDVIPTSYKEVKESLEDEMKDKMGVEA